MLNMVEKLGFLMRRRVKVRPKSFLYYSIFGAKSLDFDGSSKKIRKKCFRLF